MIPNWYHLLLIDMARGKYLNLSPRPCNQYDWIALWSLIQEQQVRVSE